MLIGTGLVGVSGETPGAHLALQSNSQGWAADIFSFQNCRTGIGLEVTMLGATSIGVEAA
jgi:hypothetical protein